MVKSLEKVVRMSQKRSTDVAIRQQESPQKVVRMSQNGSTEDALRLLEGVFEAVT